MMVDMTPYKELNALPINVISSIFSTKLAKNFIYIYT